jgi:hypothetical protein
MGGSLKVEIQADVVGPLSNGEAERAVSDWATSTAAALGKEGVDLLRAFPMDKTGRAHGGFQSNLNVVQAGPVATIKGPMITGVVWSPWLEGTSKRNSSTRFKGYHLFRKTRQELQRRAPEIGQRELDKVMPRIGGA